MALQRLLLAGIELPTVDHMAVEQARAPSLDQFKERCRLSFAFLDQFGFKESNRRKEPKANPFEVRFRKGGWEFVVSGESYGFATGVIIKAPDGRSASLGHLVPAKAWLDRRQEYERGQLGDVACQARCLREFGESILSGHLDAFNALAERQSATIGANREALERQIREQKLERAKHDARDLFRLGKYADAEAALAPFEEMLPSAQAKMLALARERA